MATDPAATRGAPALITRRTMLALGSASVLGVVGGGLLSACSDDSSPGASGTASSTTSSAGSPTTSGAVTPASLVALMSTPGPSWINAPTAIAQEMGFFADESIDVSLEYPGTSVRGIQTLVSGTGDLSVADPFAVLVARAEELDVRSVFLAARGYVFGFAVEGSSPIDEWSEETVSGSRIGITDLAGGEVPVLRGALARLGLTEGTGDGQVELVVIGGGGPETADAIESGSVDIFAGSVLDFEIFKAAGVDVRPITPDYITAFPGQGFVVTPDLLEENRSALTRFLRAQAKAIVFLHTNTTAAAEIAIAAYPASAEGIDVESVAAILQATYADGNDFAFDEDDPDFHRIGAQDPEAYDDFQKFLIETESEDDDGTTLTAEVDVDAFIDNSLIDDANDFDYAEVEALAEQS